MKFALIGYPLKHSLSAVMHNAAFDYMKIDGEYTLLETPPEDLVERIKYLKLKNYDGFNVTIPLKVPVSLFLEDFDRDSDLTGAVNTVKITQDKMLVGYNTDIYGFINAIPKEKRAFLNKKSAVVFGTGGAARAVAIGLIDLGIQKIRFYARNVINARDFINLLRSKFGAVEFELCQYMPEMDLSEFSIVVNTTPIGMFGNLEGISPIDERAVSSLPCNATVYDIVYNPRKTKLLEMAQKRKLDTIEGIDMLVLQGAKAFEIWTGEQAPAVIMKQAALRYLP